MKYIISLAILALLLIGLLQMGLFIVGCFCALLGFFLGGEFVRDELS